MKNLNLTLICALSMMVGFPAGALEIAKPLAINGCTAYPEGSWGHCCVEHDILYWIGGTFEDRKDADEKLLQCVNQSGGDGAVLYRYVRSFGIHAFSKAWPLKSADRITLDEKEAIENEWDLYTLLGQPLDFEFIVRESIIFEPLTKEKRAKIHEFLTPFSKGNQYQNYLKTYQRVTGRKPSTLQFHD